MSTRAVLAAALAGCSGGGATIAPDAQPSDAQPSDAQQCFGLYGYCFAAPPTGELVLAGAIDTTTDARCATSSTALCLIGAHDIVVTQALAVSGARPLALVGRTVQIDGSITLAKSAGVATDCTAPTTASSSHGGGAGGSFGTRGGGGGGTAMGGAGGGSASAPIVPTALRGGCPGGGNDASDGLTASGLAVIATDKITIFSTSWIDACGGGGLGPQVPTAGGGGGGSGGMVLLDAPAIEIDGSVLAIGGGGGGGSTAIAPGLYGATGCGSLTAATALGGAGPNGKGGDGATTADGGAGALSTSGAGGGGGGAGVILVHGTVSGSGAIVPPKTQL